MTIVHKFKTTTGKKPTYRYNGWKNNNGTMTSNGGDMPQTSMYSTDLGNGYAEWVATYNMTEPVQQAIHTMMTSKYSGSLQLQTLL